MKLPPQTTGHSCILALLLGMWGCGSSEPYAEAVKSNTPPPSGSPVKGVFIGGNAGEVVTVNVTAGSSIVLSDAKKPVTFSLKKATERIRKTYRLDDRQPSVTVEQGGQYELTTISGDGSLLLVKKS